MKTRRVWQTAYRKQLYINGPIERSQHLITRAAREAETSESFGQIESEIGGTSTGSYFRPIPKLAIAPDNNSILSCLDKSPKVSNAKNGKEKLILFGHKEVVSSITYSSDGTNVVSSSFREGNIKIWDSESGEEKLNIAIPSVGGASFSRDGSSIFSYNDKAIQVWDASTGVEKFTLDYPCAPVAFRVAFSPDENSIAALCKNNVLKIWDVKTGVQKLSLKLVADDTDEGLGLAYNPDGKSVVTRMRTTLRVFRLTKDFYE